MASKSTILRSNCSFSRFSKICEKPKENQWFFKVRGGLTRSKIDKISIKFDSILDPLPHVPQEASRYPQDRLKMAYLSQLGPKLGACWLQVASSWGQVGSMLPQVGPKLVPKSRPRGSGRVSKRLPGGSWEPLGVTRGQEALQEAPEVPKWPPDGSKIHEKSIKLISDLRALASE